MLILKKTSRGVITFGLNAQEYACRCNFKECTNILINETLIVTYKRFRYLADMPLKVTSGHRCHRHNHGEGGVGLSRHTSGEAIDIAVAPLLKKFTIEEIEVLAKEAGFTYFKYYKSLGFIHLDVRPVKQ